MSKTIVNSVLYLFDDPFASAFCFSLLGGLRFVACFTSPDFSTNAFRFPNGANGLGAGFWCAGCCWVPGLGVVGTGDGF